MAMVVALLAIAAQLVVMAQLAQYQVQRGVHLRQTQATGMAEDIATARTGGSSLQQHTASFGQGDAGAVPAYVLH